MLKAKAFRIIFPKKLIRNESAVECSVKHLGWISPRCFFANCLVSSVCGCLQNDVVICREYDIICKYVHICICRNTYTYTCKYTFDMNIICICNIYISIILYLYTYIIYHIYIIYTFTYTYTLAHTSSVASPLFFSRDWGCARCVKECPSNSVDSGTPRRSSPATSLENGRRSTAWKKTHKI